MTELRLELWLLQWQIGGGLAAWLPGPALTLAAIGLGWLVLRRLRRGIRPAPLAVVAVDVTARRGPSWMEMMIAVIGLITALLRLSGH
jgi:hypothetical protein